MIEFEFDFDLKTKNKFKKLIFSTNYSKKQITFLKKTVCLDLPRANVDFITVSILTKDYNDNARECARTAGSFSIFENPQTDEEFKFTKSNYFKDNDTQVVGTARVKKCTVRFSNKFKTGKFKRETLFSEPKNYKAVNEFVQKVKMPYYFHEESSTLLPGSSFFILDKYDTRVTDEVWMSQFSKILSRVGVEIKNMKQLRIDQVLEKSFFSLRSVDNPIYIVADVIADVVSRYPYISDEGESFDDIFQNQSGDCEDFARGVLHTFAELKKSCSVSRYVFMQSVGTLLENYSAYAVLGTVLAPSYEKHASSLTKPKTEQAHMFSMLVPHDNFSKCVTIECTASLSYITQHNDVYFQKLHLPQKFVKIYDFDDHSFYKRIVYMFNADAYESNKTTAFLVVDPTTDKYGVDYHKFKNNYKKFKLVKDNAYPRDVQKFVETQLVNMFFNTSLPIQLNYEKTIYKKDDYNIDDIKNTCVVLIEQKDFKNITDLYNRAKIVSVVEENKKFYRFHINI